MALRCGQRRRLGALQVEPFLTIEKNQFEPFRSVDKLSIMWAATEEMFDVQKYMSTGVIHAIVPLHSRAELKNIEKSWHRNNPWPHPLSRLRDYFQESPRNAYLTLSNIKVTWLLLPPGHPPPSYPTSYRP